MKPPDKLYAVQIITGEYAGEWLASGKESELRNSFPYVPASEAERLEAENALLKKHIERIHSRFYPLKITHPNEMAVVETAHAISEALGEEKP